MSKWIHVYDNYARRFDDPISKSGYIADGKPIPEEMFQKWISHINSMVNIQENDFILDAGCGSGVFLNGFSRYSRNIYGCDGSQDQLASVSKSIPTTNLVVGDITERVFHKINFNFIFCNSVFLLLNNLQAAQVALDNLLQMTAAGAKIWIGDIPDITAELDEKFQRYGSSVNLPIQHYPDSFFFDYCDKKGLKGKKLDQIYKSPDLRNNRYDFLIEVE
jgi:ubiquinone/menaquinone biosynthesis C-methylase UbiE